MAIDRELYERTARLEVRLDHVQDGLDVIEERLTSFRDENDRKLSELRDLIMRLPPSDPPPASGWTFLQNNWKYILAILALATGASSLAEILKLLG